ncbi:MAG: hypothetical protein RL092_874 [Bacteroidota bacterium]|jgi:hypothetical protein
MPNNRIPTHILERIIYCIEIDDLPILSTHKYSLLFNKKLVMKLYNSIQMILINQIVLFILLNI